MNSFSGENGYSVISQYKPSLFLPSKCTFNVPFRIPQNSITIRFQIWKMYKFELYSLCLDKHSGQTYTCKKLLDVQWNGAPSAC